MSFRSGAAVTGAALAVVGAAIALAVMLTGHSAAATGTPSPDAAARLARPASSAPAPATSAALLRHAPAQPLEGSPDDGRELLAGPVPPARGGGPACLGLRLVAFRPRHHLAAEAAEVDAG